MMIRMRMRMRRVVVEAGVDKCAGKVGEVGEVVVKVIVQKVE